MTEGFIASVILGILATIGILATCTNVLHVQYDNDMSTCNVSNKKYEIHLNASRDSSYTDNDVMLKAFADACLALKKDFNATSSYLSK